MIKIPDEISILHVKYKVIQVPVIDKGEGGGFILGKVNFTNNTIQIDQGLCDTLKLQTLIHEIMHAVFFQTGQSEAQNNEAVCQAAAAGLMSVIQENDLKEEYFIPIPPEVSETYMATMKAADESRIRRIERLKNQYGKQLTGRRTAYNEEERTLF